MYRSHRLHRPYRSYRSTRPAVCARTCRGLPVASTRTAFRPPLPSADRIQSPPRTGTASGSRVTTIFHTTVPHAHILCSSVMYDAHHSARSNTVLSHGDIVALRNTGHGWRRRGAAGSMSQSSQVKAHGLWPSPTSSVTMARAQSSSPSGVAASIALCPTSPRSPTRPRFSAVASNLWGIETGIVQGPLAPSCSIHLPPCQHSSTQRTITPSRLLGRQA